MNKTRALKTLTDGKHRITRTREAILDAVLGMGAARPFSAGDVFNAFPPRHRIDLVTIYRNLSVFENSGLICRADFSDETVRFTLKGEAHAHHHHHVVCRECGRVAAVDGCALSAQEEALRALGFVDLEHRLEFTATCRRCAPRPAAHA